MIPKIIHYIWFGDLDCMPDEQKKFIAEWKKILPDYDFKFRNLTNFIEEFGAEAEQYQIFKDSLNAKKYGFTSDVARCLVLEKYGGIYLDTDVKVFKKFDDLLDTKLFIGYLFDDLLGTAIIGAEKNVTLLRSMLVLQNEIYLETNAFPVNNNVLTKLLINDEDFLLNGAYFITKEGYSVYPRWFFEKNTSWYRKYEGGYTRHYCYGSWSKRNKKIEIIKKVARFFLGEALSADINNYFSVKKFEFYERYKRDRKKRTLK